MAEPFHKRFNVEVAVNEARRRFVERIRTLTWSMVEQLYRTDRHDMNSLLQTINFHLGERHHPVTHPSDVMEQWDAFVGDNFTKCLCMTEAVRVGFVRYSPETVAQFIKVVIAAVENSEFDLEISWDGKIFTRKGAMLLDEKLVNEPLEWLRDPKYQNALIPFEKGLKHWMEAHKNPQHYGDVITDVYESLEAMAKLVSGRNADLSANREKFCSVIGLPDAYNKMLKEYIDFGCEYRHAPETTRARTYPSERDTEAFIYMTGVFLRLAIQKK
ncbi:MAG: hypothetical protein WD688_08840 [Candidatus Binatia bacterium]